MQASASKPYLCASSSNVARGRVIRALAYVAAHGQSVQDDISVREDVSVAWQQSAAQAVDVHVEIERPVVVPER